jgi:hypothetical protein
VKGPRRLNRPSTGGRGARPARRDEGAYLTYGTEEQRSRPGWGGLPTMVEFQSGGMRACQGLIPSPSSHKIANTFRCGDVSRL